jgi:hypothetical protein
MDPLPIDELKDQELNPKRDFVGRVRRQIERKTATSQAVTFGWELPKLVLLEFLKAAGEISPTKEPRK